MSAAALNLKAAAEAASRARDAANEAARAAADAAAAAARRRQRRQDRLAKANAPVPGGMVRLIPSSGPMLLAILRAPPDRSGGVGGWQRVDREGRRPAKWWQGWTDEGGTLELILDRFTPAGSSVENRLSAIYRMGQPAAGEDEPPSIQLRGDVPTWTRGAWLLQDVALGARLWLPGGKLRRYEVSLTLERAQALPGFEPVTIKQTRRRSGARRSRTHTTRTGDTWRKIAAVQLGAPGRWKELATRNPKVGTRDPDRALRVGLKLRLP